MAIATPQKPQPHHRKMRGEHHRHSKHYLRTYSPYLPLMMLVIIGLAINSVWTAQPKVLGAATHLTANELLNDTNLERSRNHKSDLAINSALKAAAQAKANDMVQQNYWSHNSPDGSTPWNFIIRSGYQYAAAGENLAYGFSNAQTIINGWMNSPEHRANVLDSDYQDVGFGISNSPNFQDQGPATVVVALYGEPGSASSAAASDTSSALTTQPYRTINRIGSLTGSAAPWSFTIMSALTLFGIGLFCLRHATAWHARLVRGEAFVLRHKFLDIVIAIGVIAAVILSRTAGFIG